MVSTVIYLSWWDNEKKPEKAEKLEWHELREDFLIALVF